MVPKGPPLFQGRPQGRGSCMHAAPYLTRAACGPYHAPSGEDRDQRPRSSPCLRTGPSPQGPSPSPAVPPFRTGLERNYCPICPSPTPTQWDLHSPTPHRAYPVPLLTLLPCALPLTDGPPLFPRYLQEALFADPARAAQLEASFPEHVAVLRGDDMAALQQLLRDAAQASRTWPYSRTAVRSTGLAVQMSECSWPGLNLEAKRSSHWCG